MDQQERLADLTRRRESGAIDSVSFLRELISIHHELDAESETAEHLRRLFLDGLTQETVDADPERFGEFLVEHLRRRDFAEIEVNAPGRAALLCELFYRSRQETAGRAEQVQRHAEHLLEGVLQRFERKGDLERMFELLQIASTRPPSTPELFRLRSRAHLYEMRRARKLRSLLYGYLIVQVLLVILVFPVLFVNSENGRLQQEVEEAVSLDLGDAPAQTLSYFDGLYWSIITAASIGYGDITPRTNVGRMIAAILGTMGVLTIGVMAGLILFWITPRSLD